MIVDGLSDSRAPKWPFAVVRIYVGVVFLVAGIQQLAGADPWGSRAEWPTVLAQLMSAMRLEVAPFYRDFYRSVLVAHKGVVGTFLPIVHVAVGVPLVVGVATRVTAAVGFFVLVNYMAILGIMPYSPNPAAALAALTLAVLIIAPDKVWSIRSIVTQRRVARSAA